MSGPGREWKYDAFISYSHASDDVVAASLHSGLHSLAKPYFARRTRWVFRDKADLSASPELWPRIEAAVAASRYFVLIASPAAARSRWVKREIDCWLRLHDGAPANFLIVLSDGRLEWDDAANDFDWNQTTALPRLLDWNAAQGSPGLLSGRFAGVPLYVDVSELKRAGHLTLDNASFLDATATPAAAIDDRPKSDLIGADAANHRRYQRTRNIAIGLLTALLVLLIGASIYANTQRRLAEAEALRARRRAAEAFAEASSRHSIRRGRSRG